MKMETQNLTETCSVCGKDTSNQEETYKSRSSNEGEKNYCSLECMKKGKPTKNNFPQQEPPPKSKNNNKGVSVEIKVILGVIILLLVSIVGLIGVKIYKKGRKKTS